MISRNHRPKSHAAWGLRGSCTVTKCIVGDGKDEHYLHIHLLRCSVEDLGIHLEHEHFSIYPSDILYLEGITLLTALDENTISLSQDRLAPVTAHSEYGILAGRFSRC